MIDALTLATGLGPVFAAIVTWHLTGRSAKQEKKKLRLQLQQEQEKARNKLLVFPPKEGRYNLEFYDHFRSEIKDARSNIYITGQGFDLSTVEGRQIAHDFIEAKRAFLKKPDANMVRIQTSWKVNPEWVKLLANLLDEFGNRFELYLLQRSEYHNISSICIIDPQDPQDHVIEFMISMESIRGTRAGSVAGPAFFLRGYPALADNLRAKIMEFSNSQSSIKVSSSKQLKNLLLCDNYYFSYGSNMSSNQMRSRIKSAQKIGVGIIRDYQLVFNRRGSYRSGSVASIEYAQGERVYGVIWKVDYESLCLLDDIEDPSAYQRSVKEVFTADGRKYESYVYEAIPDGSSLKPSQDYLELIINAAEEAQIPGDYIRKLCSFGPSNSIGTI